MIPIIIATLAVTLIFFSLIVIQETVERIHKIIKEMRDE